MRKTVAEIKESINTLSDFLRMIIHAHEIKDPDAKITIEQVLKKLNLRKKMSWKKNYWRKLQQRGSTIGEAERRILEERKNTENESATLNACEG